MTSTIGFVIWRSPRYSSGLPNRATVDPGRSWRSRQGWLKNVVRMRPLSSLTSTVTIERGGRPRVRRATTRSTVTMTSVSSPTPFSTLTFIPASSRRVMGPALTQGSLDAEEVRVQRLAAVVDLGGHAGPVLVQPLGDLAGRRGRRALALDDRHDLVVVGHQRVEQRRGRRGHGGRDRPDAVAGQGQVVAVANRAQIARGVPH